MSAHSSFSLFLRKHLPMFLLVPMVKLKEALLNTAVRAAARRQFKLMGKPAAVLSGPFKGMRYQPETRGWVVSPKLLGIYEKELHATIEAIIASSPDVIVDIGSAEGYYSVGLAMRAAGAQMICYDTDRYANYLLRRNLAINNLKQRVEINGLCTHENLSRAIGAAKNAVIVCDCEGGEDTLLDPAKSAELKRATILVELHDMFVPGVSERIRARFEGTHEIQTLSSRGRTAEDWPAGVPRIEGFEQAMSEERPAAMQWFFMRPR